MIRSFIQRRRILLATLFLIGLCFWCYAQFIEREWIEEHGIDIHCPEWKGDGSLMLAVLADIHARPGDGAYIDDIVRRTLAAQPDAILLLGDYLNGHKPVFAMDVEELETHLKPLAAKPVYVVLGNHDYYHDTEAIQRMFERLSFSIVEGRAGGSPVRLHAKGGCIDIGGIRCLYNFKTPGIVPQPRGDAPLILLSHSPVGAEFAAPGTFLVLSGHTHGGQVCWPWGKPIIMADGKTPLRYSSGLLHIENHLTYVSRGLGTSILPIRFACRPELVYIRLHKK